MSAEEDINEEPIDISDLDGYCGVMSSPESTPQQIQEANEYIMKIQKRDDIYSIFGDVMENDLNTLTKITVLQAMRRIVQQKWKLLNESQIQSLKEQVFSYATEFPDAAGVQEALVNEINLLYVSIMFQEWPVLQSQYYTALFEEEGISVTLYFNHLRILSILLEEVIENSDNNGINSVVHNGFIMGFTNESQHIFERVFTIIQNTDEDLIIQECFKIFKYIIPFLQESVLVETDFFNVICQGFLGNQNYISFVLGTIDSIFDSDNISEIIGRFIPDVFNIVVETVAQTFPLEEDFEYLDSSSGVGIASECLTVFPNRYHEIVEVEAMAEHIRFVAAWTANAMMVDDIETFKTCNEFWNNALRRFINKQNPMVDGFKQIYKEIMPQLCTILTRKMPKPPEILIQIDSAGKIEKENQTETNEADIFKTVKNTLWIIARLETDQLLQILLDLNSQINSSFDPELFSHFYWSVGAISGSLNKNKEAEFLGRILQPLITLCDSTSDENVRAIIASGIMYICAQYPRFISTSFEFFHVVIFKLFEFMNQTVPGICEMAVNTFKTIGQRAKSTFCIMKEGMEKPFIFEIIDHIDEILAPLNPVLRATIFDALSNIANGFKANEMNLRHEVLQLITNPLNSTIRHLSTTISSEASHQILFALDCHRMIAPNLPTLYHGVLMSMYEPLMETYGSYSEALSETINTGTIVPALLQDLCRVKSCILQIFLSFANAITENPEEPGQKQEALGSIMQSLIEIVAQDYVSNVDQVLYFQDGDYEEDFPEDVEHPVHQKKLRFSPFDSRVPEVLDIFNLAAEFMPDAVDPQFLVNVFIQILTTTLPMFGMKNNFSSYPSFRLPFFKMIRLMVSRYMELMLDQQFLHQLLLIIEKGQRHPGSEICIEALYAMAHFCTNLPKTDETKPFFEEFLKHSFTILVDASHKAVFDQEVEAINQVLRQFPEFTGQYSPDLIASLITDSLKQMDVAELAASVNQLYETIDDEAAFRSTMRDILIVSKTFSPIDPELRKAETEQLRQQAEEQIRQFGQTEEPPAPEQ